MAISRTIPDHFERLEKKQRVLKCMEDGDWKGVLGHFEEPRGYHEPLLVWIRPDVDTLHFIRDTLHNLGIAEILSIGSGCAFLEWLISKACSPNIRAVHCLEVNPVWWQSNHSTPQYMPLDYTDPSQTGLPQKFRDKEHQGMALMFCYFNQIEYFKQYLETYRGSCVVLVGPANGKRHCDPEPMFLNENPEGVTARWLLVATHDVRNEGEDMVAIYQKL